MMMTDVIRELERLADQADRGQSRGGAWPWSMRKPPRVSDLPNTLSCSGAVLHVPALVLFSKPLVGMVGATGIEPVTPTMST